MRWTIVNAASASFAKDYRSAQSSQGSHGPPQPVERAERQTLLSPAKAGALTRKTSIQTDGMVHACWLFDPLEICYNPNEAAESIHTISKNDRTP